MSNLFKSTENARRPSKLADAAKQLDDALAELRASHRDMKAPASLEAVTLAQMRAAYERKLATYERKLATYERKLALGERVHATSANPAIENSPSRIVAWWRAITAKSWTSALAGSLATIALATFTAPLWLQYARESVEVATPFMLVNQPQTAQLDVSQMLRVNVTREAMLDFGIPVPPQRLQEEVKAEMLMGQRGELLAVRFIEPQPEKRWRWQVY
jgi:cell division protein ZapA (FtsZ GTPase activity inhibitor)